MPIATTTFHPPARFANGHVQTILGATVPRPANFRFVRERLELDDGDFLDLDWLRRGTRHLAILSHGLEGCSTQPYIRGLASSLQAAGWDVLAWNYRGCSGEANRLPRAYHSGETGDLGAVIAHAAPGYAQLALVGFSLGGNITLKYVGEAAPHAAIVAAAAISTPIDLAASARWMDRERRNRIYLRRFLKSLIEKIEIKARQFPDHLTIDGARRIRTFEEFDNRFTAPLHGFRDAIDYWARASARQFLARISLPTLLLNARNDPLLTPECFPFREAEESAALFLEAPDSGGHMGFHDFTHGTQPWSERRIVQFLENAAAIGRTDYGGTGTAASSNSTGMPSSIG
jgi:predicted alpha/beta-fold hydrolase